jgi:hypothetical protein
MGRERTMNTTKIDISTLNRIELAELRDEIVFELDLHDAELRAFYGQPLIGAGPTVPEYDDECEVCWDRQDEVENLHGGIDAAIDILNDEDLTEKARIKRALERLEQEL